MKKFRSGQVTLLVATDVVGRGIDVSGISHIINYDIPQSSDDYVHRVGRTGRMGREGVAFTFVTREEGDELTRIEMLINKMLIPDEISGFEACAASAQKAPPPKVQFYGMGDDAPKAEEPTPETDEQKQEEPAAPKPAGGPKKKRHRRAL